MRNAPLPLKDLLLDSRTKIIQRITIVSAPDQSVIDKLKKVKNLDDHRAILREHIKFNDANYRQLSGAYFRRLFHLEMELFSLENMSHTITLPQHQEIVRQICKKTFTLVAQPQFDNRLFIEIDKQCNALKQQFEVGLNRPKLFHPVAKEPAPKSKATHHPKKPHHP